MIVIEDNDSVLQIAHKLCYGTKEEKEHKRTIPEIISGKESVAEDILTIIGLRELAEYLKIFCDNNQD